MREKEDIMNLFLPLLILLLGILFLRRPGRAAGAFLSGAERGFSSAVKLFPTLLLFVTAVALFRASGAVELLSEAAESSLLRPAAMVCVAVGEVPEPEEAAAYLASHSSGVTLRQIQTAKARGKQLRLPVLINTEGGLRICETNDG